MATMDIALDEAKILGRKGVIMVYQPHQNVRQHEVFEDYKEAFLGAEKIFWLPTYLTREDPELAVISPEEFIAGLANREKAEVAKLNSDLVKKLKQYVSEGYLVVLMTAGPADRWMRNGFGM